MRLRLRSTRREEWGCRVLVGEVGRGRGAVPVVVTAPRGRGRFPAVMLLQALGNFSVVRLAGPTGCYARILGAIAPRAVTVRVDRPGLCAHRADRNDADLEAELTVFRRTLEGTCALDFVDPERILLFGHSMGGAVAPILAGRCPVRGIAVAATTARPWPDYLLAALRRQWLLGGWPEEEARRREERLRALFHAVFTQRRAPAQVLRQHPALRPSAVGLLDAGRYMFGRHYRFFQQLTDWDLEEGWRRVRARTLSLWGTADFVTFGEDHEAIASLVNGRGKPRAEVVALAGSDHWFTRARSLEQSYRLRGSGAFNDAVLRALLPWLERHVLAPPR